MNRRIEHVFSNKQLDSKKHVLFSSLVTPDARAETELAACGIGVHHAGLQRDDRSATEKLYLKKALKVLLATSVSTSPFCCAW